MTQKLRNYVNGQWVVPTTKDYMTVVNPADESQLTTLPLSNTQDVDQAVQAASQAFPSWSKLPVNKRAEIMFNFQHLLVQHKTELARTVTLENGKALSESQGEVQRGIENVEFAAGAPTLIQGDTNSTVATNVEVANYRYPLGVVAGITPFNFPMMVPCWMFPMAIVMGNTFVLKPSEKAPLLTEKIVNLATEAGVPEGVLNVVYGTNEAVNGLLDHPEVKAISFVGSKNVGEHVYRRASQNLKRVQVLAGAKNHTIVLDDADIDDAVDKIIKSSFGSAGERCMATSVIELQDGIADQFISKYVQAAKELKMGSGLDETNFLGPVIRSEAQQRTFNYIEKGIAEGAQLLLDGRKNLPEKGYFVGPTIFDHVTPDMTIWQDEMFAPVVSIVRIQNLQEAVQVADQSEFANGACLFTDSAKSIRYFRENIDAGMLGINLGVPAPMAFFPFSGWKHSFFGTLTANGKDSVDFYTRKKVVTARHPFS